MQQICVCRRRRNHQIPNALNQKNTLWKSRKVVRQWIVVWAKVWFKLGVLVFDYSTAVTTELTRPTGSHNTTPTTVIGRDAAVGGARSRQQSNSTRITRRPAADPVNAVGLIAVHAHAQICKTHSTARHPLNCRAQEKTKRNNVKHLHKLANTLHGLSKAALGLLQFCERRHKLF